jgi:hypothetical protein
VTGAELAQVQLTRDYGSVGIEFHPGNQTLYTCDVPGDFQQVDPTTGQVTDIPSLPTTVCANLAAPWGPVSFIVPQ